MNKVVEILMRRDNLTKEEATSIFKATKEMIQDCIERGEYFKVDDILYTNVGLELDYIFDFM